MGVLCDKFIPAPGDIVGQKLRSLKDKHNAREVKRKQRRLKEKADKENQKGNGGTLKGSLLILRPTVGLISRLLRGEL